MADDWDEGSGVSEPANGGGGFGSSSSGGFGKGGSKRDDNADSGNSSGFGGGGRGRRGGSGFGGGGSGGSRGGFGRQDNGDSAEQNGFDNDGDSGGFGGGKRGGFGGGRGGRSNKQEDEDGGDGGGFGSKRGGGRGGFSSGRGRGFGNSNDEESAENDSGGRKGFGRGRGGGGGGFSGGDDGDDAGGQGGGFRGSRGRERSSGDGDGEGFDNDNADGEEKPQRVTYIPPAPPEEEEEIFKTIQQGINFDNYDNIGVEMTGRDPIKPITSFEEANLYETFKENVKKATYIKPTPVQKYSIPAILAGRDLMACAQTGSGKTVQTGEYICTCGKKCKSKSGLKRHTSAKHGDGTGPTSGNDVDELTTDLLAQIVKETTLKLSMNACYSMAARDELVSYNILLGKETDEMKMLQKLYGDFQRKGNVERFYIEYYSEVPLKATIYFPDLSEKTATFLATKVADHMLSFAKKTVLAMNQPTGSGETTTATSLSEREISGGQYIGGYVFHNLHKKLKSSPKWKSPESQQAISILEAARVTSGNHDQKLISCLNRGGLWAINSQAQDIIFKTEQFFRESTTSIEGNKLEINTILRRSLSHPDILSAFNNLTADAELEPEKHVAMDTLNAIIHLYVKVRAFSLAKDLVQKYKLAAKSKSKQKSLRKEIQRAADPPPQKM